MNQIADLEIECHFPFSAKLWAENAVQYN